MPTIPDFTLPYLPDFWRYFFTNYKLFIITPPPLFLLLLAVNSFSIRLSDIYTIFFCLGQDP
jgi:hypothetical protein